jgi:nitroreductase
MEARRIINYKNYGVPPVIYLLIDQSMFFQSKGINVWSTYDFGSVVQNIMLLVTNYGLGTVAQAQAVVYPDLIRKFVDIPTSKLIALGIAIGHPDWDNPATHTRSQKEPLEKVVTWYGLE